MKKNIKFLFWIEFITGILLIIGGAILFIGLPDKTAAHCLLIVGLVQLIIAVVLFIFRNR